jgi:hypothetical protein
MTDHVLLEPSFADVAEAVDKATELSDRIRPHWLCALRQIAKAMNRRMEMLPARWTGARQAMQRLHPARIGLNPKTLANYKSNVRAALLWFADDTGRPLHGVPLSAEWAILRGCLEEARQRRRLSGLIRYCSAKQIRPEIVDEAVLDGYMRYRAETTALASDSAARRRIARVWNGCVETVPGWPKRRLVEPPAKPLAGPDWTEFPEGLRSDIERYLGGLTKVRRGGGGRRIRPCKDITIRTRRAELVAFARMAVRQGIATSELTSLGAMLNPEVVEKVIDAYWRAKGDEPGIYTINLAWKLLSVARETGCLSESGLERLDEIRAALDQHRQSGLTEKNLSVIRQVLSGTIWREVVNLPKALMLEAREARAYAPMKAAVTAQLAVGIAIETVAPVRLNNLVHIKLDENLIRPGGPHSSYWLVFPGFDVKNRVQLEFPLEPWLTEMIDEYVHDYRPTLLRGSNGLWLFPGETGGSKKGRVLSLQLTTRIEKATGVRLTVHQFRHAAAAILLKHRPGEYELVRLLLGHRNIQTTMNFYVGLQSMQASEIFGKLVFEHMAYGPEASA